MGAMPIPTDSPALDRGLLRDDIYRRLRDAIIDGTFGPGEQLRDLEVAEWLGVSRTPVREALLRLAQAGLVIAQPGRSTIVAPLDQRACREARDVVAAMHELAVHEAVPSMSTADVDEMRAANERFERAIERGDVDAALRADDELHAVPVTIAANRALSAVLDQFSPLVRRAERLRFASSRARESVVRHAELIRLCAAGDAAKASALAFDTFYGLSSEEEEEEKKKDEV